MKNFLQIPRVPMQNESAELAKSWENFELLGNKRLVCRFQGWNWFCYLWKTTAAF